MLFTKKFQIGIKLQYLVVVGGGKSYDHLIKLKSEYGGSLSWVLPYHGDWHILFLISFSIKLIIHCTQDLFNFHKIYGLFTLLIVYGKEIHLKTNMYSHLSKVLGNVKKTPYIINQNHIFFNKIIVKSFLDRL